MSSDSEEAIWNECKDKPLSIVFCMPATLSSISTLLTTDYNGNETKLHAILKYFSKLIDKNRYLTQFSGDASEIAMNFLFNLVAVSENGQQVTVEDFISAINKYFSDDAKDIKNVFIEDIDAKAIDMWNNRIMNNNSLTNQHCDVFISCTDEDAFQYYDGFLKPLFINYNLNVIYPHRDLPIENIGMCERYISQCQLYLAIVSIDYNSDHVCRLFSRRAQYHSKSGKKKLIVSLMDLEPKYVGHERYMRPPELEDSMVLEYNESDIDDSYKQFQSIVSKIVD